MFQHDHGFVAHIFDFWRHVRVEKRLDDHFGRQPHHVAMDRSHLTGLPRCQEPFRKLDDRGCVRGNSIAMKRRLRQTPLPKPEIAFARQQPLPEEPLHERSPIAERFAEITAIGSEHVFDVRRVVQQTDRAVEKTQRNEIAVVPDAAFQKSERVSAELLQVAQKESAFRAGPARSGC
jgi:hypothetical protein